MHISIYRARRGSLLRLIRYSRKWKPEQLNSYRLRLADLRTGGEGFYPIQLN